MSERAMVLLHQVRTRLSHDKVGSIFGATMALVLHSGRMTGPTLQSQR